MRKIWLVMFLLILVGCEQAQETAASAQLSVMLDWTPNTNHTGLYVAQEQGYFEAEGLDVEILLPGQTGADQVVASGQADIGIGSQQAVTLARAQDVPIVSVAAIIQHNTSGFAAPVDRSIASPSDFEGKTYGGWGDPIEEAMLDALMMRDQADIDQVEIINIGQADFFTAVEREVDFAWIYYGWTGIEAEVRGIDLDILYLTDYAEELDYYTPVFFANEKLIDEDPEMIEKFVAAVAKGYQDAIQDPDQAAGILLDAVPDLDEELVYASQAWLADWYQAEADQWGIQQLEVWQNYANWLDDNGLIEHNPDVSKAFTNQFLPE
ncbi:ABC transporter substrate-binding protein [Amphibacillus cookii]|uniref:ABC transporter substrate-binding protein n=1 Tax=Amphibacillus cookii TaxID=767787 RepID=UPI001958E943|nr:ABC transporter substrate-binding protein [Amphibacillus cookii]MBM7540243.1 ABC-type nitrate/sulfonate/bicarbonate transport system substrate-binding protein [Amphibacillus cookii]